MQARQPNLAQLYVPFHLAS